MFRDAVDDDRYEERLDLSHVVRPIDGEFPLPAEVAFEPLVRVLGDDRNEQRAVVDLLEDGSVRGIPAPQLALVEPHFDARGP